MYWGTTNVQFYATTAICQRCGHPDTVVMKRAALRSLLEDARKLTHPDINGSAQANRVTALINAALSEL